ncbi:MAG: esterase/lipase family protein [Candidatus Sericytochromatia bacterium]
MSPAYSVTRVVTARPWARIERLTHAHEAFPTERARPNGRQTDAGVVHAFGTATPMSRDVLLHFGPAWEEGAGPPVVLVHGATADATYWIDPYGRRGEGLVQALEAAGRRVFAVTFAHRHGDNLLWAESLSMAIARVREATGAARVDVLSHSKGSVAARALASGLKADWMFGYQGDIRRLVIVGGPNMGIDYSFRHPLVNYGLYAELPDSRFNAPLSWTRMLAYGRWVDTRDRTLLTTAGNYFPGQCQMLYRWDRRYELPLLEPDVRSTYYGGRGLVSESAGIAEAIAQGGHFIEQLREQPLDRAIELAVLAGSRANRLGMLNEQTGPSDGTLFVESALATDDMTRHGAKIVAKDVLPLNHAELIYAQTAKRWALAALAGA